MESPVVKFEPEQPRGWNELLGPFAYADRLDETVRGTSGLIILKTASGTEICPAFQFDKDEAGQTRVNPQVALVWSFISVLHIDQLGRGQWTEAGWLAQLRPEYGNRSWADVLKDSSIADKDKLSIYAAIMVDAVNMAAWSGDPLIDPRTLLPE